jgi:hypothetical protein
MAGDNTSGRTAITVTLEGPPYSGALAFWATVVIGNVWLVGAILYGDGWKGWVMLALGTTAVVFGHWRLWALDREHHDG